MSADRDDEKFKQLIADTRPDSELSRDEVIARNLTAVEAHFHNENPMYIDKAIAVYADDVNWEAPARGQVDTDKEVIRGKYLDIFKSYKVHKTTFLRRFATEQSVFDDQVLDVTVVDDSLVPNLPYKVGDRASVRLVHCFEMRDGRITHEIGYEVFRIKGAIVDVDAIPADATFQLHDDFA